MFQLSYYSFYLVMWKEDDPNMVTDYIREYVKQECSKNTMARELYENHIILVSDFGAKLSKLLGADALVVELASYLHDFSSIYQFDHHYDHTIPGVHRIDGLLRQFKFSDETIARVLEVIAQYNKPNPVEGASKEAVCLINADAMSQLSKPLFWLYFGYTVKNKSYNEGITSYLKWMESRWKIMMEPAKEMMAKEYEHLKRFKR